MITTQNTLLDTVPLQGTIDLWFKPGVNITAAHATHIPLMTKYNDNNNWIGIWFPQNDNRLDFSIGKAGARYDAYSLARNWSSNTWYHATVTWGPRGMEVWINGTLEGTNTFTGTMNNNNVKDFWLGVGAKWEMDLFWTGRIDEVKIYGNQSAVFTAADPCAGVTCNSPPASVCSSSTNIVVYNSPGTCSAGMCTYTNTTQICGYGCSNGQCGSQPVTVIAAATGTALYNKTGGSIIETFTPGLGAELVRNTDAYYGVRALVNATSDIYWNITVARNDGTLADASIVSLKEKGWFNATRYATTGLQYSFSPTGGVLDASGDIRWGVWSGDDITFINMIRFNSNAPLGTYTVTSRIVARYPGSIISNSYVQTINLKSGEPESSSGSGSGSGGGGGAGGNVGGTGPETVCNFNAVCETGEKNCKDCIAATVNCPLSRQCSDGRFVSCHGEGSSCSCEPCPFVSSELPLGCVQETYKDTGFLRVACTGRNLSCPTVPEELVSKCSHSGGTPKIISAPNRCDLFQCDFGTPQESNSIIISPQVKCPTPSEISNSLHRCSELGLKGVISFDGPCSIGKCIQENQNKCSDPGESVINAKKYSCNQEGNQFFTSYDSNGCKILTCGECSKQLPDEVYNKCQSKGGEILAKYDFNGCVVFSECIRRGDVSDTSVEQVKSLPADSEIVSMKNKLDELSTDFERLSKESGSLTAYYRNAGSIEEARFSRVSDILETARGKISRIRKQIDNSGENMTIEDATKIKSDIRYVKEVMIKDILFLMLSSSRQIDEIKSNLTEVCETPECFASTVRICKKSSYVIQGDMPLVARVIGLDGDRCNLDITYDGGSDANFYEMNCKIKDYALGISNPETDLLPYCTGNLVTFLKTFPG